MEYKQVEGLEVRAKEILAYIEAVMQVSYTNFVKTDGTFKHQTFYNAVRDQAAFIVGASAQAQAAGNMQVN